MAVNRVNVLITGDNSSLKKALDQSTTDTKGFGSVLGGVAKIAAGFVVAQGLIKLPGLLSGLSSDARKLELNMKKAGTVFGEELAGVTQWASKAAASMGLTKNEAIGLAANFADLLIPMGFTRKAAAEMAEKTIGLAGALSEWSGGAKSAAEVSDILTKAYLGETDGLKALGISISAAEIETRLLEKGQKDLTGTALAQAKAIATQELVFEKSIDAQKAFAEGSGSAARKHAELTAKLHEAKDALVVGLMPAFTAIATTVAKIALPAIDLFSKGLFAVLKAGGELTDWIRGKLLGPLADLKRGFEGPREPVDGLVMAFKDTIWTRIGGYISDIWGGLKNLASITWGALRDGVDALGRLAAFVWDTGALQAVGQFVVDVAGAAWSAIKDGVDALVKFGGIAWDKIKDAFPVVVDAVVRMGGAAWDKISPGIDKLIEFGGIVWEAVSGGLLKLADALGLVPKPAEDAKNQLELLIEAHSKGAGAAADHATGEESAWERIRSVTKKVTDVMVFYLEDAAKRFQKGWDDISEGFSEVTKALGLGSVDWKSWLTALGIMAGTTLAGIGVAFTIFADVVATTFQIAGKVIGNFFEGLAIGIEGGKQQIQGLIDFVVGVFTLNWDQAWKGVTEIFKGTLMQWEGVLQAVGITPLLNLLGGLATSAWSAMSHVGSEMVAGIQAGFSAAWGGFIGWLFQKLGPMGEALQKVMGWAGIRSPSKLWADKVGAPIAQGIGVGFVDAFPGVVAQIEDQFHRLYSTLAVNMANGTELTLTQIMTMFSGIMQAIDSSPLPAAAKKAASDMIDGWVDGMAQGQGVSNTAIMNWLKSQTKLLTDSVKPIAAAVTTNVGAPIATAVGTGFKSAFTGVVAQIEDQFHRLYSMLKVNLANGTELTLTQIMTMFSGIMQAIDASPLDRAGKDAASRMIDGWVDGMAEGRGVANSELAQWLKEQLALIEAAAAAAAKAGRPPSSAATSSAGGPGGVGFNIPTTTGGAADLIIANSRAGMGMPTGQTMGPDGRYYPTYGTSNGWTTGDSMRDAWIMMGGNQTLDQFTANNATQGYVKQVFGVPNPNINAQPFDQAYQSQIWRSQGLDSSGNPITPTVVINVFDKQELIGVLQREAKGTT